MRRLAVVAGISLAVAGSALGATAFTPARHANPPLLVDHGYAGKPIRLMAFVPNSYPDAQQLIDFVRAIRFSTWWKDVSAAFRLPSTIDEPKGMIRLVDDMPPLKSKSTSTKYEAWVARKVASLGVSLDDPSYLTVYVLYIPCTGSQALDGLGCASHHKSLSPTKEDALALITSDPAVSTDSKTVFTSHELAEAATDTGPNGWFLSTAHKQTPWVDASPWVEDEGSGVLEAADESSGDRWYEQGPGAPGTRPVYEYDRIFSDAAAKRLGDPAVPPTPYPYYNVFADGASNGWYHVARGAIAHVHLNGWSTASFGRWNVSARVSQGRAGTGWNPTCRLVGTSSWTGIGNAEGFTLSLATSATSAAPSWCVVKLQSSLPSSSPFANHGDDYHSWFVGFVIR